MSAAMTERTGQYDDRAVAKSPERDRMVHIHRDRTQKAVAVLFEDLDRLGSRLSPVLIFEDSPQAGVMPGQVSAPTTQSETANAFDGTANDLELIHRQLSDIIRRLDI